MVLFTRISSHSVYRLLLCFNSLDNDLFEKYFVYRRGLVFQCMECYVKTADFYFVVVVTDPNCSAVN